MNAFLTILFLLSSISARAVEPTYSVDTNCVDHPVPLASGSPAETDAYNNDSADNSRHPVFGEMARLDFAANDSPNQRINRSGKSVRVALIGSRHDGDADTNFIRQQIQTLGLNPKKSTLFIEQSDWAAAGGGVLLAELVRESVPELSPAIERSAQNPLSIASPHYFDHSTFAAIAHEWELAGGHVVRMDTSVNFTPAAVKFLAAQVGAAELARELRLLLDTNTFTFPEYQILLTKLYPEIFSVAAVGDLTDCCGTSRNWVATFLAVNQVRDLARERYMRLMMLESLHDGDVIVTHPVHLRHLLAPEKRPEPN